MIALNLFFTFFPNTSFLYFFKIFGSWLPFYLIMEVEGRSVTKRKHRRKTYLITGNQYFEKSNSTSLPPVTQEEAGHRKRGTRADLG